MKFKHYILFRFIMLMVYILTIVISKTDFVKELIIIFFLYESMFIIPLSIINLGKLKAKKT